MLEQLIKQLGQELDMTEQITKNEEEHYLLSFEPEIDVEAIECDKCHLLKGAIGPCPTSNGESFLMKVMEANLFGRGTRGSVIGIDNEEKMLTLTLELDYNSSYKDFKEKLEDFISVVDFWRKQAIAHK